MTECCTGCLKDKQDTIQPCCKTFPFTRFHAKGAKAAQDRYHNPKKPVKVCLSRLFPNLSRWPSLSPRDRQLPACDAAGTSTTKLLACPSTRQQTTAWRNEVRQTSNVRNQHVRSRGRLAVLRMKDQAQPMTRTPGEQQPNPGNPYLASPTPSSCSVSWRAFRLIVATNNMFCLHSSLAAFVPLRKDHTADKRAIRSLLQGVEMQQRTRDTFMHMCANRVRFTCISPELLVGTSALRFISG